MPPMARRYRVFAIFPALLKRKTLTAKDRSRAKMPGC